MIVVEIITEMMHGNPILERRWVMWNCKYCEDFGWYYEKEDQTQLHWIGKID